MAKFRRKAGEVEAEQYVSHNHKPYPPGLQFDGGGKGRSPSVPYVTTSNGQKVYVQQGDWIIAEPGGGYYPCNPEIFHALYDPVEE
jgi:hypothetical protein